MWDKARRILYRGGEILELLMAAAVVAGILVAMITLVPELARYWEHRTIAGAFMEYLDAVFNVVIGIEFLKMLCKPSSANIIEVLIFLIARHMIVQTTTPLEDLLSVVSISILFLFPAFMLILNRTRPACPEAFWRDKGVTEQRDLWAAWMQKMQKEAKALGKIAH